MSAHVAEGNIIAATLDTASWGRKLLSGKAGLTEETVAMMKEGKDMGDGSGTGYGLGLIVNTVDPGVSYGHTGSHYGYLTSMFYFPGIDVIYVVFSNIWDLSGNADSISAQANCMREIALEVLLKMGYLESYPPEDHTG